MMIKSLRVENYRSIKDETIPFDQLTALVGRNGTGKSSFLRAIDLFYNLSSRPDVPDFHAMAIGEPIRVTITYGELTEAETDRFNARVQDGEMSVTRVFRAGGGQDTGKYYGRSLQNSDCKAVREQPSAGEVQAAYNELRGAAGFEELPAARGKANIVAALADWELAHPGNCAWMLDDGQFFGFTNVAQGVLSASTKFVYVPAVWDAAEDAVQGKGSPFRTLTQMVLDHLWHEHAALEELKTKTQAQFDEITAPENVPQLRDLADGLTQAIRTYYDDVSVDLEWGAASPVSLTPPAAEPWIVEDNFRTKVENVGHGLQRAFIISLLQQLAVTSAPQAADADEEAAVEIAADALNADDQQDMHLILAIEEPEIYQHPNQQRHLASVLHRLASGDIAGVANKLQVVYSTHCPLFVEIDRYEQVRVIRKARADEEGAPRQTRAASTTWSAVKDGFELATEEYGRFTETSVHARYHVMNPFVSEGFFADVAVLVEGASDRAAVLAAAGAMDIDLEARGIAVLPCEGKTKMGYPAVVFDLLGIDSYLVWDGDKPKNGDEDDEAKKWNIWLQRLSAVEAPVDWPDGVFEFYACFETDLETTLKDELGEDKFDELRSKYKQELGIGKGQEVLKNPVAVGAIIRDAAAADCESNTLQSIVRAALAIRDGD